MTVKLHLRHDGVLPPFLFISRPVRSSPPHVCPTFLELADAETPADHPLDGESLVPLFRNAEASLKRAAIFQHFPGCLGIGANQWRTTPVGFIGVGDWKLMGTSKTAVRSFTI